MAYKKINTLQELKELATGKQFEGFIALAGGLCRSSKTLEYFPESETWYVYNEIDGSEHEDMYDSGLIDETNIVDAINNGAFYQY